MQINPTAIQKITSFKNLDCLSNPNYEKEYKELEEILTADQEDIKN